MHILSHIAWYIIYISFRKNNLVKLYAPQSCFLFFGIFQEYSMEYSIFQFSPNFCCFAIFPEYSWNIPYSKILKIFAVFNILWNIPYSKILKIFAVFQILWNIPYFSNYIKNGVLRANLWFSEIFHIPKKSTFLLFCHFSGIFQEYSIFQKNQYFCCFANFLDYSIFLIFIFHGIFRGIFRAIFHGIFHIPKNQN